MLDALRQFEIIGYAHVDDACVLLNDALTRIPVSETRQLALSDVFAGRCSEAIRRRFVELSDEARALAEQHAVAVDSHLLDIPHDLRLGISLIVRPADDVKRLVTRVRDQLHELAPDHHYYDPLEYHVTVATLISAKEPLRVEDVNVREYVTAVSEVLQRHPPFRIQFRGVAATRDGVVVKGFFRDGSLDEIRQRILEPLVTRGMRADLKERHESIAAHVTVMRFRNQSRLMDVMDAAEVLSDCELGVSPVGECQLVLNDWYMSRDKVRCLASLTLGSP
jgi:2'-5' RNA ligase